MGFHTTMTCDFLKPVSGIEGDLLERALQQLNLAHAFRAKVGLMIIESFLKPCTATSGLEKHGSPSSKMSMWSSRHTGCAQCTTSCNTTCSTKRTSNSTQVKHESGTKQANPPAFGAGRPGRGRQHRRRFTRTRAHGFRSPVRHCLLQAAAAFHTREQHNSLLQRLSELEDLVASPFLRHAVPLPLPNARPQHHSNILCRTRRSSRSLPHPFFGHSPNASHLTGTVPPPAQSGGVWLGFGNGVGTVRLLGFMGRRHPGVTTASSGSIRTATPPVAN